jgi:hypothetical protein
VQFQRIFKALEQKNRMGQGPGGAKLVGYACGKTNGKRPPLTFSAPVALAAGRQPDAMIRALGAAAAKWVVEDAIGDLPRRLAE